ncbi:MAG: acyl-CoA dehydrogenase family protein [Acidimicrobiia bacterium]
MDHHLEQVLEDLETAVHIATSTLASRAAPGASARDSPAHYDLAFLASEAAALRSLTEAAQRGAVSDALLAAGASRLLRSARARLDGRRRELGLGDDALSGGAVVDSVQRGLDPAVIEGVLAEAGRPGHGLLPKDLRLAFDVFRRFGAEVIEPHAEAIHRNDEDIPESILSGLAAIGAFGLSIPEEYGGTQDASGPGTLAMVVATEALSEASLGAGGSLITRPEILAAAVLAGGTEAQKSDSTPCDVRARPDPGGGRGHRTRHRIRRRRDSDASRTCGGWLGAPGHEDVVHLCGAG